jgi:hypothetical protein
LEAGSVGEASDQEGEVKGMSPGVLPGFRNVQYYSRQSQQRIIVWMRKVLEIEWFKE